MDILSMINFCIFGAFFENENMFYNGCMGIQLI